MVRVVAAPHDAPGAHERRQRRQRALVDLEADGALAGEVLRGTQRHVGAEAAERLGLLVQALEPERGPPAGRLEEDAVQARVALEHPERDELGTGQHLLEGMRDGVEDQRVERAVRPERRHDDRAALVDPDGHAQLLGGVPHDVVGAVGERAAEAGVGADEARLEAELGDGPAQLVRGGGGVLQGQQGGAEEPVRICGAVRGQPVVVVHGQADRRLGVLDHGEVQPEGGVEHGLVDALGVHVGQAGHRVAATGLGVGQGPEGRGIVEGRARAGQGAQRHGQDLGTPDGDMFVAVGVRRDYRAVRLGQPGPGVERLDDVAVGVDHRTGAGRQRGAPVRHAHGAGWRQSSTAGRGWRKSREALPPTTARNSSSGSAPQVSASTRCVSGHEESACG